MTTRSGYTLDTVNYSLSESSEYVDTDLRVDVVMGSFAVSNSLLISKGYCNCIALIGLGAEMSLLGHFQEISKSGKGDSALFLAATATLNAIRPQAIVLAGGGLISSDLSVADRAFAESHVRQSLLDSKLDTDIETRWTLESDDMIDVAVHHQAQRIIVHQYEEI
jgi:hypothetical protein